MRASSRFADPFARAFAGRLAGWLRIRLGPLGPLGGAMSALVLVAAATAAPSALGQGTGAGAADPGGSGKSVDAGATAARPKNGTPHELLELCAQGDTKFAKHDVPGAIERYRVATTRFPSEPLGYALLGESLFVAGNVADARVALTRGAALGERDPDARARSVFVLAVLEEHQKNWDAARTAWQSYLDARKSGAVDGGAPATAEARIRVIDTVRQQETAAAEVRKRIAATADGGVFSDPSKPPQSSPAR